MESAAVNINSNIGSWLYFLEVQVKATGYKCEHAINYSAPNTFGLSALEWT